MSLKLLLNLIISALMLVLMMLGAVLTIINSQEDIRAELESTAALTLHLIDKELIYFADSQKAGDQGIDKPATPFSLNSLGHVRHLKVEYYDNTGKLRDSNKVEFPPAQAHPAPAWFAKLLTMVSADIEPKRRKIYSSNQGLGEIQTGEIVVTPDPSYEISEVWNDSLGLLSLTAIFFFSVNIMVYWAVSKALRPIDRILDAINELERGNLNARLPAFKLPELRRIGDKFNNMAYTLQHSIQRNQSLTQKLMQLQEEERRSLSQDLHDEIGQSLTAIYAEASVIANGSKPGEPVRVSAEAIVVVAKQVIAMVRNMLHKLRPETLDKLGLKSALQELVTEWQQRYQLKVCELDIADDLAVVPEMQAIAMYRVVQECLTNVARHAQASLVTIRLWAEDRQLILMVEDNGAGFDADRSHGFGLVSMRERIIGLGGEFELNSMPGSGTTVISRLPMAKDTL